LAGFEQAGACLLFPAALFQLTARKNVGVAEIAEFSGVCNGVGIFMEVSAKVKLKSNFRQRVGKNELFKAVKVKN